MRHVTKIFMAAMVVLAAASITLAAGKGSGGWGMGGAYQRMFNPATVETVSGEVQKVEKIAPLRQMGAGIHLVVKTDKETIPVHLGPEWFIKRLDAKVGKGDRIEVSGSRITLEGKPVIIASEVRKGDETLLLRDSAGVPVWSGWRRK